MDFRPNYDWHTQWWRWMNLAKSLCLNNINYPWVAALVKFNKEGTIQRNCTIDLITLISPLFVKMSMQKWDLSVLYLLEANLKNVDLVFQKMTCVKFSWICMMFDIAKCRTEQGFYKDNFSPKGLIEIRHHFFFSWIWNSVANIMFYSIYATTRLAKLKFARIRFHLLSAHGSIPLFWNELVYSYGFTSK